MTLSAKNMPAHTHKTTLTKVAGIGGTYAVAKASGGDNKHRYASSSAGGGQPHNNMPPYIALYFCQKD